VYDPFGSWVQDWIRSDRVRERSLGEKPIQARGYDSTTYLAKESASEDALSGIEPIDDRICVLLHRGSENHERIPS